MIELLAELHFIRPGALLLFPALAVALLFLQRTYTASHSLQQSIDPDLLPYLISGNNSSSNPLTNKLPFWLAVILIGLACIAAAGPSFEKLPQPPLRQQQKLVIIADLTLSMHAEDIKPSRLVRMRYKLLELLKQRKEGQTALIAYSGDAHIVSPLTDDSNTIAALIPALKPEIMPQIGSNAGAAFTLAQQLLGNEKGSNKLVWFTDGYGKTDLPAIKALLKSNSTNLIVVGIGTAEGAPVRLPSGKFLKDANNQIVQPRLDDNGLQKIASELGAQYLALQNDNSDIAYILAEGFGMDKDISTIDEAGYQFEQWLDRGAWLLLVITPFTALAFRRGWLLVMVLSFGSMHSQVLQASDENLEQQKSETFWQKLWQTPDQRGADYYQQGKFAQAQQHFENNNWKGISAYQNQDFEAATRAFTQSIDHSKQDDPQNTARAHYNNGHALAHAGQLEKALAAYDRALALTPDFEHANQARQIIEQLLSEQQKQQSQSEQNQQQNQNQQTDQQQNQQQSEQQLGQQPSQPNEQQSTSDSGEQQQNGQSGAESEQQQDSRSANNPSSSDTGQHDQTQPSTQDEHAGEAEQTAEDSVSQSSEQQALTMINPDGQPMDAAQAAALEQWLNKIQDDPAGLLRRKFQYQQQLRERSGQVVQPDEKGNIW